MAREYPGSLDQDKVIKEASDASREQALAERQRLLTLAAADIAIIAANGSLVDETIEDRLKWHPEGSLNQDIASLLDGREKRLLPGASAAVNNIVKALTIREPTRVPRRSSRAR